MKNLFDLFQEKDANGNMNPKSSFKYIKNKL